MLHNKKQQIKQEEPKKEESASPLLERYLQRNMTDRMKEIDDEALAKAIKTLLYEEKSKKHLN